MENRFTPELIAKARQTKSPEELIALAEANGITITEDEVRDYFALLNGQCNRSGELSDDELDNVSGGGCHVKVDGQRYTVVTSTHTCEHYTQVRIATEGMAGLRNVWMCLSSKGKCGWCAHLRFKGGTGYCNLSGK